MAACNLCSAFTARFCTNQKNPRVLLHATEAAGGVCIFSGLEECACKMVMTPPPTTGMRDATSPPLVAAMEKERDKTSLRTVRGEDGARRGEVRGERSELGGGEEAKRGESLGKTWAGYQWGVGNGEE